MKTVEIPPDDLALALTSTDPLRRNQAFKTLYMNPKINGKIRDWVAYYNPWGKDADDILQESIMLLDAVLLEGRFRGESAVETFFLSICKNLIRDSAKKVQRIVLKDPIPELAFQSEDALADFMEISEQTEAEARRDQLLHETMEELTEKCREALRLFYFEQKKMAELAGLTGLANDKQAKKAVFRCREQLRKLIEKDSRLSLMV